MALLRRVIGDALRARRQGQHRTLREISTAANVSLGYLSEIERGQKEASSELLAAICEALGSHLSEVLREASDSLARAERADQVLTEVGAAADVPLPDGARGADQPVATPAVASVGAAAEASVQTVTDGNVSVSVRHNGPFRTSLHVVRARRQGNPVARTG